MERLFLQIWTPTSGSTQKVDVWSWPVPGWPTLDCTGVKGLMLPETTTMSTRWRFMVCWTFCTLSFLQKKKKWKAWIFYFYWIVYDHKTIWNWLGKMFSGQFKSKCFFWYFIKLSGTCTGIILVNFLIYKTNLEYWFLLFMLKKKPIKGKQLSSYFFL